MAFTLAAMAIVADDAHRVLLVFDPEEQIWLPPGGHLEPGESPQEAVVREVREEVGVEAEMIGFLDHAEVIQRDDDARVKHHFVICAHAARWTAGDPQPGREALDVRWVNAEEAARLPTTPGLAGVLRQAFALNRTTP